jgi:hypothetical protein
VRIASAIHYNVDWFLSVLSVRGRGLLTEDCGCWAIRIIGKVHSSIACLHHRHAGLVIVWLVAYCVHAWQAFYRFSLQTHPLQ